VRDDFTTHFGRHQLKLGGEFLEHKNQLFWPSNQYGTLTANLVAPPANLEFLFPVWNDPSTWNLALEHHGGLVAERLQRQLHDQ
jgi:hypothetical protein